MSFVEQTKKLEIGIIGTAIRWYGLIFLFMFQLLINNQILISTSKFQKYSILLIITVLFALFEKQVQNIYEKATSKPQLFRFHILAMVARTTVMMLIFLLLAIVYGGIDFETN